MGIGTGRRFGVDGLIGFSVGRGLVSLPRVGVGLILGIGNLVKKWKYAIVLFMVIDWTRLMVFLCIFLSRITLTG